MARSITAVAGASGRNRGILMLAVVFGVASAALVFAFLGSKGDDSGVDKAINAAEGSESVVVVTRNIQVGEKITGDMLTTRTLPKALVLPGGLQTTEDVVGKVATAPLFAGEQALAVKVTTFEGQNTLAYKVPDGMRALSLQVPHEAWIAAGLVQPGDRVDILAMTTLMKTDPLTGEEKPSTTAVLIAQDIEILAVSQALVKTIPNLDARAKKDTTESTGTGEAAAAGDAATSAAPAATKAGGDVDTYEKSISITIAAPPELAAGIALIDAMKDDVAQYRIMPRQKGDTSKVTGNTTWTLDDVIVPKKK